MSNSNDLYVVLVFDGKRITGGVSQFESVEQALKMVKKAIQTCLENGYYEKL